MRKVGPLLYPVNQLGAETRVGVSRGDSDVNLLINAKTLTATVKKMRSHLGGSDVSKKTSKMSSLLRQEFV